MRRGYTMLEVLVVMGLAAIIMGIATLPMAQARASRELDTTAQVLAATISFARQSAVSGNGAVLRFSGRDYQVEAASGAVLRRGAVPESVNLIVPAVLTFRANGTLSSGETLTLSSPGSGLRRSITIAASTGTATLGN